MQLITVILFVIAASSAVIGIISGLPPPTVNDCRIHREVPFPDPTSCTGYYQCFRAGTWELIFANCPPGSAWDDNYKSCTDDPSLCQEGKTTPPAVKTPPPAVKPAKPPSANKPAKPAVTTTPRRKVTATHRPNPSPSKARPTSTSTKPPADNPCLTPGVYKNPTNCQAYYRCITLRGKWYKYHHRCPVGSYFSTVKGKCIAGVCTDQ